MNYKGDIKISLARKLRNLWKKNRATYEFVLKKIDEIIENPNRHKYLGHDKNYAIHHRKIYSYDS